MGEKWRKRWVAEREKRAKREKTKKKEKCQTEQRKIKKSINIQRGKETSRIRQYWT